MFFAAGHGKHTYCSDSTICQYLPVHQLETDSSPQRAKHSWIPVMLFEPTAINSLDTAIYAIDGYFVRS